jgi:hypothetical protein
MDCFAGAGEVLFRAHEVDTEATFSAAAAIDVNRDGRLDIVAGKWWYESPTWKRHFARDVEFIRGRYDDYAHLPVDVNGDGRMDLVTANYRSEKLAWIEQPADPKGVWTEHMVEKPGPMETGRLADVNGDGRMDVLPNGRKFAAWWEIGDPGTDAKGRWVRHELPEGLIAHGIGFGDIDGDGRGDVVGPGGWARAIDPANGEWAWRPEFALHHDASVPILVMDVDGDGDSDLVWGRGHHIGLYWMEQIAGSREGKTRQWIQHAIDTSWSEAHTVMQAAIDGDGKDEVIAGKRYMGHDGTDPGEYDSLVIYAYDFDVKKKTWDRVTISSGGRAGLDLDPKAVDLDGDGDVDLLAPGRSGLFWFENLRIDKVNQAKKDLYEETTVPMYSDHRNLLTFLDEAGRAQAVKTAADWAVRRSHVLGNLERVMGRLPDSSRRVPLEVQVIEEIREDGYVRQKLTYAAEPGDRVPAYLLIPDGVKGKAPAMLCLHQTVKIGKGEPAGLGEKVGLQYAHELAQRGYVCLAPDYPSFGDYAYDFNAASDQYVSGSMKAIWNNVRALDLLQALPFVDGDRIGCIGHSLGGHNTIFSAVWDQRIRVAVSSCGFTGFKDYYRGDLAGWTSDRYMPRIRDDYGNDPARVPFDFHELVGALAPRPFFVNAPLHDGNFEVSGVREVIASAAEIYELREAKDRLTVMYPDAGHSFPDDVRMAAYAWLDKWLKIEK